MVETGLLRGKRAQIPVDPNIKLLENQSGEAINKGQFQRLVGKLIYFSHTRPDIAFGVSLVSQFMHSPNEEHMQAVRIILHYLKATPRQGILFAPGANLKVQECTNADYGGSLVDRQSTTGYCVFL